MFLWQQKHILPYHHALIIEVLFKTGLFEVISQLSKK